MTIDQMFALSNRFNSAWGIEGYEVPKKYCDPIQQIKEREYLKQKKGQKPKNAPTKRGNFLDDITKLTKHVPGPQKYDVTIRWVPEGKDKKRPKSAPTQRVTYITEIFRIAQKRAIPGVGKYNLQKTDEQIKKDLEA